MATEAQKRAHIKYQRTHIQQVNLKLNRNTDADIIKRLEIVENTQSYIKRLIREDIKNDKI